MRDTLDGQQFPRFIVLHLQVNFIGEVWHSVLGVVSDLNWSHLTRLESHLLVRVEGQSTLPKQLFRRRQELEGDRLLRFVLEVD